MKNWRAILIGVILAVLVLRGGLPALVPLIRFGLMFVAVYFVIRALKGIFFVKGAWDHLSREAARYQQNQQPPSSQGAGGGTTIDICPQCGDVLGPRHRCRS